MTAKHGKISIGVASGCALWLQRQLNYNRWECGRISRRVHINLCSGAEPQCWEN